MDRWSAGRGRRARRYAWIVAAGLFLAPPGTAAAHTGAPTVALDFQLKVSNATRALPGVRVDLVDGDRGLRLRVDRHETLIVRGDLGEPVIRFDAAGVWVNRRSPTAAAVKLAPASSSAGGVAWDLRTRSHTLRWHDHRLAPPRAAQTGVVGRWSVPILVNGNRAAIEGTFVRVRRPRWWVWGLVAVALAAALAGIARWRPPTRPRLLVAAGALASLGALASASSFATADEISGASEWVEVGAVCLLLALAAFAFATGRRGWRPWLGAATGVVCVAFSLSAISVFGHGYVISTLPPTLTRLCVLFAVVAGAATAVLSIRVEYDSASARRARGRPAHVAASRRPSRKRERAR